MTVTIDKIAVLEAENDALRDRIAALERALMPTDLPPRCLRLTASEAMVLAMLMRRREMTKDQIFDGLYALRANGDDIEIKVIDVFICKLRTKLRRFDIAIETLWGRGYAMTPEAVARLQALKAGEMGTIA